VKRKDGTPRVAVTTADGRRAICLESRFASFSIQRHARIDLTATPVVEWTWRAAQLPGGGDLRRPDRDDQAAQLFVAFSNRRAISYVWDTTAPVGTVTRTRIPFVMTIVVVVVHSGAAQVNTWVTHRRNVRDDYAMFFEADPPRSADAVRFQINSQYTRTTAQSCLAALAFEPGG
jgi:hypothetical protein